MRAVALVFLVGCVVRGSGSDPPDVIGDPPTRGFGCHDDSSCASGMVCARTSVCLSPSQVRAIHVSWTVSGKPAGTDSCAAAPNLRIDFNSSTESLAQLAFAPVPCAEGKFSVDKAPISIDHTSLVRDGGGGGFGEAKIDAVTGEASMDLPY
jgi:hypothetical protein